MPNVKEEIRDQVLEGLKLIAEAMNRAYANGLIVEITSDVAQAGNSFAGRIHFEVKGDPLHGTKPSVLPSSEDVVESHLALCPLCRQGLDCEQIKALKGSV